MGFFSPWFLAGLTALGLPLWLHLLRQHKTTPKHFSSLMFFEQRTQSSIKHRRLRYLVLLAMRLLLLLLVALAFAAPYIRHKGLLPAAGGRRLLVVGIDNSYSMRAGDRLARAKQEAAAILQRRDSRQQAQVLTISAGVQAMTQATTESGELRAAVDSIQPTDSRSSFGEFARALRAIEQAAKVPIDAHLISDMQKTSLPPAFKDLQIGEQTHLVVHKLLDKREPNWAVENVVAPRSVFDPKKARVLATVAGFGTEAAKRNVTLSVNNRVVASKIADIPANGRATVEFVGLDATYGFNRGEVHVDAGDVLAGDDHFNFAVERSDPRSVLFVHDGRQQRGLLYYRAALDAASEGAFLLDSVPAEQSAGLAVSKYGFVVLSDVGTLPSAFEETLKNYVRGGGGVLISAGPASAARRRLPIIDMKVGESRYASRGGERFLVTGSMDVTHPVLRATGRWENVKFYQLLQVEPGESRVLARLSDETPLLIEQRLGEGHVLVFTSTLDNISNDFPLHPSFVPFVEQTARYLVGTEVRPSSYTVDSHVQLRAERGGGTVEVLNPRGQRAMSLKDAATASSFPLTEVGFYDIGRSNGRHELVAVNADRKESDFELVPDESLALWQGTSKEDGGGKKAAGAAEPEEQRASLWWYVMVLAVVLALVESLLASHHLPMEPLEAKK